MCAWNVELSNRVALWFCLLLLHSGPAQHPRPPTHACGGELNNSASGGRSLPLTLLCRSKAARRALLVGNRWKRGALSSGKLWTFRLFPCFGMPPTRVRPAFPPPAGPGSSCLDRTKRVLVRIGFRPGKDGSFSHRIYGCGHLSIIREPGFAVLSLFFKCWVVWESSLDASVRIWRLCPTLNTSG